MTDVLFKYKEDKEYWDFDIINGEAELTEGFETAEGMSLFLDKRASSSEVEIIELRRGWFGNLIWNEQKLEYGSKLWLLYQSRLTNDVVSIAKNYIENALIWLVEDQFVKELNVSAEKIGTTLNALIKIFTNNNVFITSTYTLFKEEI